MARQRRPTSAPASLRESAPIQSFIACAASQPCSRSWKAIDSIRSRLVRNWLERQDGHIAVAALPPYAPELNPVEAIWAYVKKHEIANLCLDTIAEASDFARCRLKSMQRRPRLIRAFWKQADLAL